MITVTVKTIFMKKLLTATATAFMLMTTQAQNPLFEDFNTEHGTPPFSLIKTEHYEEAIDRGLSNGLAEVEAIVNNPEAPTFENTIVAFEKAGKDLSRVEYVFGNLLSALSDDEMMAISMRVTPKLSDYSTSIMLNEKLWSRIKKVYDSTDKSKLTAEDAKLLQDTYDSFARNGALLGSGKPATNTSSSTRA